MCKCVSVHLRAWTSEFWIVSYWFDGDGAAAAEHKHSDSLYPIFMRWILVFENVSVNALFGRTQTRSWTQSLEHFDQDNFVRIN